MAKRLLILICALLVVLAAAAEGKLKRFEKNGKYGFKDELGWTVVIPCLFDFAWDFHEGLAAVKQKGVWGYVDLHGDIVIPLKFDFAGDFCEGLARVGNQGKYGFIDKSGNIVVPCKYDYAWSFSEGLASVVLGKKKGYVDRYGNFSTSKRNAKAGLLEEEIRRYGKSLKDLINSKLGTFDAFLASKSIKAPDVQAVQAQVEREIAQWQQKGEFETTAAWKKRVTEQTRADKAREIAGRISADYNRKLTAAKSEYRERYDAITKEYCDYHANKFKKGSITLHRYDADNQTFLISTENFGDILLPVPVEEAPAFKANWESVRNSAKVVLVPAGDNVAISSVSFGKYVYDSDTRASYASVDVDYNFKPIDLATLDYKFESIDKGAAAAPVSTPAAKGVAPRTYTSEHRKISAGTASDIDTDIPVGSATAPSTFAVIIANSDYTHASTVENAANDGRTMERYLTRTLGIPESNVTACINATYGQMVSAVSHLRDIADAYAKDDFNVLFYYVGHGLPGENSQESYILPVDADPRNTEICYPLEKLYSQLGELGASRVTVMVDACFSGTNHGDGMLVPQAMGVRIKPRASSPRGNMVVLSAATADETAFPYAAKGHGLFTYWLLKKIRDTRGKVTLGELSDYVTDNVRKTSVVENRKPQTPIVATSPSLAATWRQLQF